MITTTAAETKNAILETRTYTEAEIALNKYIREHYPDWGCIEVKRGYRL